MKKHHTHIILFVIFQAIMLQFFLILPTSSQSSRGKLVSQKGVAFFPSELTVIDEEAFEGTALQTLVFEANVLQIGERAFKGTNQMKEVFLPRTMEFIADSAFSLSTIETVYGLEGSYAESWARKLKLVFKRSDYWFTTPSIEQLCLNILLTFLSFICPPLKCEDQKIKRYLNTVIINMRPQVRPELIPIDYRFP